MGFLKRSLVFNIAFVNFSGIVGSMTQAEKLITVLEIIVNKLFEPVVYDSYLPMAHIRDNDLLDVKMSFHSFGATLNLLHDRKIIKVEKFIEPPTLSQEEIELREEISHLGSSQYGMRYQIFIDGNPWRVLQELEDGVAFKDISTDELGFDKERSILEVQGKTIQIARQIQKPVEHYILAFLFENDLKQEHGYAELKDANVYDSNISIATYINACKTLNTKIKKDTGGKIEDFLPYGKTEIGSIQINPKYLS